MSGAGAVLAMYSQELWIPVLLAIAHFIDSLLAAEVEISACGLYVYAVEEDSSVVEWVDHDPAQGAFRQAAGGEC